MFFSFGRCSGVHFFDVLTTKQNTSTHTEDQTKCASYSETSCTSGCGTGKVCVKLYMSSLDGNGRMIHALFWF